MRTERAFVGAVHCGLPGHRDRKGLRRERGERVILHLVFHYCQPFVMTLASTLYTYAALGLNICVCVCEHVCVKCIQRRTESRSKTKHTLKIHNHGGDFTYSRAETETRGLLFHTKRRRQTDARGAITAQSQTRETNNGG